MAALHTPDIYILFLLSLVILGCIPSPVSSGMSFTSTTSVDQNGVVSTDSTAISSGLMTAPVASVSIRNTSDLAPIHQDSVPSEKKPQIILPNSWRVEADTGNYFDPITDSTWRYDEHAGLYTCIEYDWVLINLYSLNAFDKLITEQYYYDPSEDQFLSITSGMPVTEAMLSGKSTDPPVTGSEETGQTVGNMSSDPMASRNLIGNNDENLPVLMQFEKPR
ncbi:MAG TPA: hypothetical protein VN372_13680 [Methanospirillum sp.]|nr:hypothetical protein [Methanospirillum sp.]